MKPSRTALYVALFRALESEETQRESLFVDSWAKQVLPMTLRAAVGLSRLAPLRAIIRRYVDRRARGAYASVVGRTRYIDDVIKREVATDCPQVVILGAGFDCRAHRMKELAGLRVFEVDRAQTQAYKRLVVERHKEQAQPLTYVEVDFQRDDLAARLGQCGWDRAVRTTFVWEGVTSYLSADAVHAVFEIVGQTAKGSVLVFTYLHGDVISAPDKSAVSTEVRDYVRSLGEPWTYGIDPSELEGLLHRFGLVLEDDLGADQYPERYPEAQDIAGYSFNRIALARVS